MKKIYFLLLMAPIMATTVAGCSSGKQQENQDNEEVSSQFQEIISELRSIRTLLEEIKEQNNNQKKVPKRPETADIALNSPQHLLGEKNAPVTVVEFTDYQCPYCKRFATNTFPMLRKNYIENGKVNWVVKDLPLAFHPEAKKAAQAAYCAGDQGKFWEMRDSLFRNSAHLEPENLVKYAEELGLKKKAFGQCLESDRHLDAIESNARLAGSQQLTGTPSFIIGSLESGRLKGRIVVGAQSVAVFSAEIEKQLQEK